MASVEYTHIINPAIISGSRIGFARSATVSGEITQIGQSLARRSVAWLRSRRRDWRTLRAQASPLPAMAPGRKNVTELFFNSFQGHQNF